MIFHGVNRELPIFLAELNQSLREADDILEVNVLIYHSVRHQERILQSFRKINWG